MGNKKHCEVCNDCINSKNWARHEKSISHLKNWARREGIHEFDRKKANELLDIRRSIESKKHSIYGLYGLKRLRKIAEEEKLEVVSGKGITRDSTRNKIIKHLYWSQDKKNQKLHIYTLEKLREKAEECGIQTSNLSKEQLIEQIFRGMGLSYCKYCKECYGDVQLHEKSEKHSVKTGTGLEEVVTLSKTGQFKKVIYNNIRKEPLDIPNFLQWITPKVIYDLKKGRKEEAHIKMYISLECKYEKDLPVKNETISTLTTYHTKTKPLFIADNLNDAIDSHFQELINKEVRHQPDKGSGWTFSKVNRIIVSTAKFNPLTASSYIDLPDWIKKKKACINIKNEDHLCFAYSILCSLINPPQNAERVSHYASRINDPIFKRFDFPMKLCDISKFENDTRSGKFPGWSPLAINVFTVDITKEKEEIIPAYNSDPNKKAQKIVDLLLVSNGSGTHHYVYIKDLNKLLRSEITKHHGKIHFCRRCLSHFYTEDKLNEHELYCGDHKATKIIMPYKGSTVRFKNFVNKFEHPFIIYADFETINEKLVTENNSESKTIKVKRHMPYGFAIYLVSRVDGQNYKTPFVYRARTEKKLKEVPTKFIEKLEEILMTIAKRYDDPKPLNLTPEEEDEYQKASRCHICETLFTENGKKVRDHCHLTSRYMGAAHQACNLKRSLIKKIPVVMHNMSNFDSHLFIDKLFHYNDNLKMTLIANSEEKYISFIKNMFWNGEHYFKLCFIDSFRFLSSPLEKLARNLSRNQMAHLNHFIENGMKEYLGMNPSRAFQILRGKGVFPYDLIDDLSKLKRCSLLDKSEFYDTLNNEEISDLDYYLYKYVWHCLRKNKKTLGFYSDLYNIQDVLLLADVFENFRAVCLENYKLDPAYYLTAPSLAWDAMLKMTQCKIGLISDVNMHLMIERGIRGGIAQVCKRHVVANNEYLDYFDKTKPTNYLMYFDASNLYGWALSQPLPYNNFEWVSCINKTLDEMAQFVLNHREKGSKGYILEVDMEYPQHLHEEHKDVPFGASHYNNKLCTTFHKKERYIVHVNSLKQMLKHGLCLTKVHRIIGFNQKPFMRPYVKFNSDQRQKAENDFEKDFYKLMVNSVYGRTMMNLRKRQNIKLCNEAQASKLSKSPRLRRWTIFNDDLIACHMLKNKLFLNQPIQIGCCVLELSKVLMYEFMYDHLKVWDPSVNLVLMDTDSYLVEMKQNPYEIMRNNLDHFDTSNYPKEHPLYSQQNKCVPGKFKDELGGNPMTEVCGLRAKLYNYTSNDNIKGKKKEEIRCKGIKKNVARNTIKMKHFKEALFEDRDLYRVQMNIRSVKHTLFTEKQKKLALSAKDNKRYICSNKVDTLPWAHFKISDVEMS